MLRGLRLARLAVMKPQKFSISMTRSTARRTASAFVPAPSAFRARAMATTSTKKDFRVYRTRLVTIFLIGICYALYRHTSTALVLWQGTTPPP